MSHILAFWRLSVTLQEFGHHFAQCCPTWAPSVNWRRVKSGQLLDHVRDLAHQRQLCGSGPDENENTTNLRTQRHLQVTSHYYLDPRTRRRSGITVFFFVVVCCWQHRYLGSDTDRRSAAASWRCCSRILFFIDSKTLCFSNSETMHLWAKQHDTLSDNTCP